MGWQRLTFSNNLFLYQQLWQVSNQACREGDCWDILSQTQSWEGSKKSFYAFWNFENVFNSSKKIFKYNELWINKISLQRVPEHFRPGPGLALSGPVYDIDTHMNYHKSQKAASGSEPTFQRHRLLIYSIQLFVCRNVYFLLSDFFSSFLSKSNWQNIIFSSKRGAIL